jgi:spermidine/putrescine transport system permease protein
MSGSSTSTVAAAVRRDAGAGHDPVATPTARRLLAMASLGVYLFLYGPIIILVAFSFNVAKRTAVWQGFTFAWYEKLWENTQIHGAVQNSLTIAGLTTVIATLIGTPAGIALARYRFAGETGTRGLLYLPIVIPEVVTGVALITLFATIGMPLSLWTVLIAHVVFSVSYVAILVRARLAGVDRSLEESAADLGAPPAAVFLRVTLPLLMPAILAGALLVFTISLDDYLITSFVAGVGSTTLPLKIYSMLKVGVTPEVNAISTLLLVFTVILILAAQMLLGQSTAKENRT